MVRTDSSEILEEALCLGKHVLVMLNTTEKSEALDFNTMKFVGTGHDLILSEVSHLLEETVYNQRSQALIQTV